MEERRKGLLDREKDYKTEEKEYKREEKDYKTKEKDNGHTTCFKVPSHQIRSA